MNARRKACRDRTCASARTGRRSRTSAPTSIASSPIAASTSCARTRSRRARSSGARYDAMMRDARAGAFDVLVVWALDCFGESALDNLLAVRELDAAGVAVVSAREPWLDTSGPFREPMLYLVSWLAEQERKRLVERTRAGMARAREKGTAEREARSAGRDASSALTSSASRPLRAEGRSTRAIAEAVKVPRTHCPARLEAAGRAKTGCRRTPPPRRGNRPRSPPRRRRA